MLQIRKVIVGISGGVDSAVAALLLKQRGYILSAVFMQNWDITDETGNCNADEDYKDAVFVCKKLSIPLQRVNFVKQYWNDVFSNLLNEYNSGQTPNPDVLCNKFVKFNSFYHYAREHLNGDAIATGHYANTSFGPYLENFHPNNKVKLLKAKDLKKDQTLFLCQVNQEALQRTMFPLGEYMKPEIKQIAIRNGLEQIAKKRESMGICFIGLRNFQNFISEYIEDKPGHFVNVDDGKIVGEHNGIHQWTLGQRTKLDGLAIAYFTGKKNPDTNDIYVASGTNHPFLFSESFYTEKPYWIHSHPKELENGNLLECDFKFQHVENFIKCIVCETHKGLIVSLECPRRALTPGQFAVFYKNNECLGSAKITNCGPSQFTLRWLQNNGFESVSELMTRKDKLFTTEIKLSKEQNTTTEYEQDLDEEYKEIKKRHS